MSHRVILFPTLYVFSDHNNDLWIVRLRISGSQAISEND
jgi:hypothetical protein